MTERGTVPRTILVTGGCGYLGSQLIRDLAEDSRFDATVRILDNMQDGNHAALMDLPDRGRFEFVEGDILDRATVRMALAGVDAIVHLAAVVRTPMSFDKPTWVQQVNHWGTLSLVEAALDKGIQRFIFGSSSAVYGPGGPFVETDPCRPQGAYGQSKLQAETGLLAASQRGLKPTILRLGILYGAAPVIRFDAVANRFAYLAGTCRKLTIYGEGKQRRSLLHVGDASSAVQFSLANPDRTVGEVFNVVSTSATILEMAEAVLCDEPEATVHFTEQDIRTHLNLEMAGSGLETLGWQPSHTLRSGMSELIKAFRGVQRQDLLVGSTE